MAQMTKETKKPARNVQEDAGNDPPQATLIRLPESLQKRLGAYALDTYGGKSGQKNSIIIQALDEWLKQRKY